jgi:hypothetical protein
MNRVFFQPARIAEIKTMLVPRSPMKLSQSFYRSFGLPKAFIDPSQLPAQDTCSSLELEKHSAISGRLSNLNQHFKNKVPESGAIENLY